MIKITLLFINVATSVRTSDHGGRLFNDQRSKLNQYSDRLCGPATTATPLV